MRLFYLHTESCWGLSISLCQNLPAQRQEKLTSKQPFLTVIPIFNFYYNYQWKHSSSLPQKRYSSSTIYYFVNCFCLHIANVFYPKTCSHVQIAVQYMARVLHFSVYFIQCAISVSCGSLSLSCIDYLPNEAIHHCTFLHCPTW